jgi:2-polyprenyl-3-methyl-5-hydroxy-6-metoxy-1,4-benzoquinol methylase
MSADYSEVAMFLLPSVAQRARQPERMDQPDLPRADHFRALQGLRRINRWSGSARILWPAVRCLAREVDGRPLRLLDIATGGGDLPVRLWRRARRAGLALQVDGCDVSPQALEFAHQTAEKNQADVHFFPLNALKDELPADYDIITSSLFLHHLSNDEAVALLERMRQAARQLVLINDLIRCTTGLLLAHLASRLLTTSPMVHWDAPRSVEAAFTPAEALQIAKRAGMEHATVGWRWPFRYLLSWRRS